ncbi:MAG: phosphoenolpyruvate synthase [Pseudomonadota bacterium]
MTKQHVIGFEALRMTDVEHVGGKNASLGEMISQLASTGVRVPGGFATTAEAFREFLEHSSLTERVKARLEGLDTDDIDALTSAGKEIRQWVLDAPFQSQLEADIREGYAQMCAASGGIEVPVAVRSSATAEDLPDASFAGQQETFLNISGIENILQAVKVVFASLYNDRAIAYRVHKGFAHADVALSAGIQRMVRSDLASSGVMFTMDTESGFDQVVFVTSSYGLGETVVQGAVNPDEFYVYKPNVMVKRPAIVRRNLGAKAIKMIFTEEKVAGRSVKTIDVAREDSARFSLNDTEVNQLAEYALIIEKHYQRPMDIEWGKDGIDGQLYILQARPETVKSQESKQDKQIRYRLKNTANVLAEGRAIGQKIGQGTVRLVKHADQMDSVKPGDILVTDMTDPDWEPVMKRAAAIVTNRGGRTCHAAIIARELGIPAVVGCGNVTEILKEGDEVTVSCAEGDTGHIYPGLLQIEVTEVALTQMPASPVKIMMNVGNPELAFDFCQLPNEGVGLARLEFIINRMIGIHPQALLEFESLPSELKSDIATRISGYASPREFYVQKLIEGISTIAAAFHPRKVIVRMSDFKSNEYSNLVGGQRYEPHEENPMLGFRGASRYVSKDFAECFNMECEALKFVRDVMGLTNLEIMIPFVRTLKEAEAVVGRLSEQGLRRGENGLRVIMMCEIPSNAVLADRFLEYFDGFSIGSNDMTQLTLAIDRDSGGPISASFDERNDAVKAMLSLAITACHKANKYIGICGQGPSDHPDLAEWLMEQGIESISLNPDTVIDTWLFLAKQRASKGGLGL